MTQAARPQLLNGLSEIASCYDLFLLDQYGVLHDGKTPYPGVNACLDALARAGKAVVVLSNSAKRADYNLARLARLGVATSGITRLVSSGEAFHADLQQGGALARHGWRRCIVIASDADRSILAETDLLETTDLARADFILLIGIDPPRVTTATLEPILAAARARGLPMVCANPDTTSVLPMGLVEGPGSVALRYAALGGSVHWYGKPHPAIFESALAAVGCHDKSRAIMVGDAITHDVHGAHSVGIPAVLVLCGIHRAEALAPDGSVAWDGLAGLCAAAGATPAFVLRTLAW